MLVFAQRRNEVGHLFGKDIAGILGPAAAGGAVQRVDRLALVSGHDAARVHDRLRGHRIFRQRAEVHLARVRRADVVAFVLVLPQVALDVGPGGHGLGLQRLDLAKRGRVELVGDDAPQVVLERQLVDDRQSVPDVAEYLERSAVGARLDLERCAGRLDTDAGGGWQHEQHIAVQLHGRSVLQVGLLQGAGRGGVDAEHGGKRRRARGVLLDAELARRPNRDGGGVLIEPDPDDRLRRRLRGSGQQEQHGNEGLTHAPWWHSAAAAGHG
jgi:hypothetical protein